MSTPTRVLKMPQAGVGVGAAHGCGQSEQPAQQGGQLRGNVDSDRRGDVIPHPVQPRPQRAVGRAVVLSAQRFRHFGEPGASRLLGVRDRVR